MTSADSELEAQATESHNAQKLVAIGTGPVSGNSLQFRPRMREYVADKKNPPA